MKGVIKLLAALCVIYWLLLAHVSLGFPDEAPPISKVSKDGRYMLRAYRKDEYQVALQGQIIETGIGFIITLDYDKFREIFQKSKEKKPKKNQNNQVVEFK